jgi:hypothetical protein
MGSGSSAHSRSAWNTAVLTVAGGSIAKCVWNLIDYVTERLTGAFYDGKNNEEHSPSVQGNLELSAAISLLLLILSIVLIFFAPSPDVGVSL